jgi:plastocyanin
MRLKLAAIFALFFVAAVSQATDSFRGLGSTFVAYGISGDGNVVVGTAPSGAGRGPAYADAGGTVYPLAGPVGSVARKASYDGTVIAGDDGNGKPVSWVKGAFNYLPLGGASSGEAGCVSDDGRYIFGIAGLREVKWIDSSTLTFLPHINNFLTHPSTCSPDGNSVAGYYYKFPAQGTAIVKWDSAGIHIVTSLGNEFDGTSSYPAAIDENAGILGWAADYHHYFGTDWHNNREAVWDVPPTIKAINQQATWDPYCANSDLLISAGGYAAEQMVCGGSDCGWRPNNDAGALIASPSLGLKFVPDVLLSRGVDVGASGWQFGQPDPPDAEGYVPPHGAVIAMSRSGQTLLGWGIHNGAMEYWVAHLDPHSMSLTVDPFGGGTSFVGGTNLTGSLEIFPGAGINGDVVNLNSDHPNTAVAPASVTIDPQAARKLFFVPIHGVQSDTPVTLQATTLGKTLSTSFHVLPADLESLTPPTAAVQNGQTTYVRARLNGWAGPQGAAISVSSSDPQVLSLAHNLAVVAYDHSSVLIPVKGGLVNQPTIVTITATYRGITLKTDVTVVPPALTALDSVDGPYVYGSRPATLVVGLSGNAGAGGAVVSLTSSNSAVASPASPNVTVSAGAAKASFTVNTKKVSADTSVTITASYNGVQKTRLLRVESTRVITLSGNLFKPQSVYAAHGDLIVFTNSDDVAHTVTPDKSAGPNSDGQYPSGFKKGQTYTFTVPYSVARGTRLYYHDRFFGSAGNGSLFGTGMTGLIIVH